MKSALLDFKRHRNVKAFWSLEDDSAALKLAVHIVPLGCSIGFPHLIFDGVFPAHLNLFT